MASVIVNEQGELYGGFSSEASKPIWFKTKRDQCVLDDVIAKTALRQLKALGYERIVMRDANGIIRKWVPADLDASAA
jgi:hypothetical protein